MRKTNRFRNLCKIADLLDELYHAMSIYDDLTYEYRDEVDVIEEMCRKTNDKLYPLYKELDSLVEQKKED